MCIRITEESPMSRPLISVLALATAALFAVTAHAAADTSGKTDKVGVQAFTGALKLQKTYFETATASGAALASGSNPYGSALAISCTNTAGCFVIVNANAQVQGIATVNPSAITIKVNGVSINSPFNTPVSTSSFTVMNYQTGISVPLGNHTITTEVFVSSATSLYRYNTEVKLYKQ